VTSAEYVVTRNVKKTPAAMTAVSALPLGIV